MAWGNNKGKSVGLAFLPHALRTTIVPLVLMLCTPIVSLVLAQSVTSSSEVGFFQSIVDSLHLIKELGYVHFCLDQAHDPEAWRIIATFVVFELALMRLVPGKLFLGPVSPMGNTPKYTTNGVACFIISLVAFFAGVQLELFKGGIVFHKFVQLVASMNVFALMFCAMLYVKGLTFPSSTDSGSSGNMIMDYYWGTELYPRILGWDVKVFTNCRFGMMFWAIGCLSFGYAQYEMYGALTNAMLVSVGLQLVYVAKFFYWETGYFKTIDIMHDRAGYYICWGCMVWLPTVYTAHTSFLVNHHQDMGDAVALCWFAVGVLLIYLNYAVDAQRMEAREKDGNLEIWGRRAEFIVASYTTDNDEKHESKLFCSGWWGLSRKINYLFEISAAFMWSVPVVHFNFFLPFLYVSFLTILLLDRAYRDNARCASKYGKDWEKYCERVPYLLVPGLW